jgi:hypothetical protein
MEEWGRKFRQKISLMGPGICEAVMRGMVGQGYTAAFAPCFPGKAISKYIDDREHFYFKCFDPLGFESGSRLFRSEDDKTT